MNDAVSEIELHAFIDGELPPERAAAVEAAMARDPLLAARVRDFRADKRALIAAYGRLADAPVAAALLKAAQTGSSRPATKRWGRYLVLAGAAALAASLLLTLTPRAPRDPAIEQALGARDHARTPSRELDGRDLANIEAANQAMSDMLGNSTRVPDLQRAGFKLVSAELYGRTRSDAVQLRYEDAERRLFTVFLRPSAGPDAFNVTERGPRCPRQNCSAWPVWPTPRWAYERHVCHRMPLAASPSGVKVTAGCGCVTRYASGAPLNAKSNT
jgi:anti-sigma factor RsiW